MAEPHDTWSMILGYKSLKIAGYRFSHDTHPDDGFLENSGVAGSAGTTQLGRLHFAALGFGYEVPLTKSLVLGADAGGLIGPNLDDHQNDNDPRPPANAAFVYSSADYGVFGALGLSYGLAPFELGVQAQLAGVWVESGWDRYNHFETQHTSFELLPSAGPKVAFRFSENSSVELTAQFGATESLGLQLRLRY